MCNILCNSFLDVFTPVGKIRRSKTQGKYTDALRSRILCTGVMMVVMVVQKTSIIILSSFCMWAEKATSILEYCRCGTLKVFTGTPPMLSSKARQRRQVDLGGILKHLVSSFCCLGNGTKEPPNSRHTEVNQQEFENVGIFALLNIRWNSWSWPSKKIKRQWWAFEIFFSRSFSLSDFFPSFLSSLSCLSNLSCPSTACSTSFFHPVPSQVICKGLVCFRLRMFVARVGNCVYLAPNAYRSLITLHC